MPPVPAGSARPLLVTADPGLLDDLLRLCAAAGVEAEVAPDEPAARSSWAAAPLVVLGADAAPAVARSGLARRPGLVLVGLDLDDAGVWDLAVDIGADTVVFLPDAQSWLVDRLGDVGDGAPAGGTVVAVVGGRGGAGASTLAAALATVAAADGMLTMLVDADPLGGGLDLVLGREEAAGLRWPDLTPTAGRLSSDLLRRALPHSDGLTLLSCGRDESLRLPAAAVGAVLAAARRAHELVVVDLARHLDECAETVLSAAALTLLLVPAEVRAAAAAARLAAAVTRLTGDLRVVVRGPAPSGLTGGLVAEALGLPLAGAMAAEPDLARALEHGRAPASDARGPLAGLCRALLTEVIAVPRRAA